MITSGTTQTLYLQLYELMSPKAFPTDIHKKLATKTAKSNSNIQPRPRRPRNICQMHGTHLIGTQRGHQRVLTLGAATHQDFRHFFLTKNQGLHSSPDLGIPHLH